MVSFIHTSDWQLGMHRDFFSNEGNYRYIDSQFKAITELFKLGNERNVDFILVAGDVFEHFWPSFEIRNKFLDALYSCNKPIIFLPGNHDYFNSGSIWQKFINDKKLPKNVSVLTDSSVHVLDNCDTEIIGVPRTSRSSEFDPVSNVVKSLGSKRCSYRILVAHGQVDQLLGGSFSNYTISLDALKKAIDDSLIDYIALGDRHSTTNLYKSRICYSGAPLATDFNEVDSNTALLVELDLNQVRAESIKIGNWVFCKKELDLGLRDSQALNYLKDFLNAFQDKPHSVLRLTLLGTVTLKQFNEIEQYLEEQATLFAALDVRKSSLARIVNDDEIQGLGLSGFALDALNKLKGLIDSNSAESQTAADAIALLYRFKEEKSYED
jgi:DNA repair exonuclease SbcCD nuclease subunit